MEKKLIKLGFRVRSGLDQVRSRLGWEWITKFVLNMNGSKLINLGFKHFSSVKLYPTNMFEWPLDTGRAW